MRGCFPPAMWIRPPICCFISSPLCRARCWIWVAAGGPVGTVLGALYPETARITMSDVNGRALALAERNSRANGVEAACVLSDGFEGLEGPFDAVVLNPPIHAGKSVIFGLYEGAFSHLREKGRLFVVIQKKHGAESTIARLEELFGGCEILYRKKGMYVLEARK